MHVCPPPLRTPAYMRACAQVGDQLDRGDNELRILLLLERLQKEAAAEGGALHVLNGNHETMNVMGDLRYATAGALSRADKYMRGQGLCARWGLQGSVTARSNTTWEDKWLL